MKKTLIIAGFMVLLGTLYLLKVSGELLTWPQFGILGFGASALIGGLDR